MLVLVATGSFPRSTLAGVAGPQSWLTGVPGRRPRAWVEPGRVLTDRQLEKLSLRFESARAEEVIAWAVEHFGRRLCVAASMADAVLMDVASRVVPGIEVVFVDTGYHFSETLDTAARAANRYPIRLKVVAAPTSPDDLWRTNTDACCAERKVKPMENALRGRDAWLSGMRRADSVDRRDTPIVTRDKRGLVKVHPLATWSDADIDAYIATHDVVVNPLVDLGYPSIGCRPCTQKPVDGADPRSGRWAGSVKSECGLNL